MVGFVRFESDTPDSDPSDTGGHFLNSVEDAGISFPGGSLGLPPNSSYRQIVIGADPRSVSGLEVQIYLTQPYSGVGLDLSSHDPSFFDPSALPLDPPSLATLDPYGLDNTSAWGHGTALSIYGPFELFAELTSLVRVPEPHVGALVLVLVAFTARRHRVR